MSMADAEKFEQFLKGNSALLSELRLITDRDKYLAKCSEVGRQNGFNFTAEDYRQWKTLGKNSTGFNGGSPSSYSDIIPAGALDTTEW